MWAAITSHAHIWGFHGNVHIAWGVYYIGIIILHLIPCTLQNIDESVPVCLKLIMPVPCLSSPENVARANHTNTRVLATRLASDSRVTRERLESDSRATRE